MIKRLIVSILFIFAVATSANAACTDPIIITPGSGSNQNMSVKNGADGNCQSNVDWDTSSQAHADITSAPTLGQLTGGWTPKLLNALSTTVTSIKSSAAGQLGMLQCSNSNTATVFIQVFDVATAGGVTLGTTTPKLSFEVPAGAPSGYTLSLVGIQFSSGIQVAATTTATGSTAQTGTLPNCNAAFN